jgi:hypothetical protein
MGQVGFEVLAQSRMPFHLEIEPDQLGIFGVLSLHQRLNIAGFKKSKVPVIESPAG